MTFLLKDRVKDLFQDQNLGKCIPTIDSLNGKLIMFTQLRLISL